jgi:ribulose-5-phosphate 4-epimerase/fuculose-1-phosphate aldolase
MMCAEEWKWKRMRSKANSESPANELVQTMRRIYHLRMTTTSGGNLSLRDRAGNIWVTPSRIDKGRLKRENIVCLRPDGSQRGPDQPSSELPFHQAIYAARPDLKAIVHAHSRGLQAFSIVGQVPDTRISCESLRLCGRGGFASYALPGSEALGREIARVFQQGHNCVILENHGVVVGGNSMREAFERFEMFEFTAMAILRAKGLGEVQLPSCQAPNAAVPTLSEFDHSEQSHEEVQARELLVDFVGRAYEQKLMTSTSGELSVRLSGDALLVTPQSFDRGQCTADDLVLVREAARERGKTPHPMLAYHKAIFARHPEIAATVTASPLNTMALSITDAPCDSAIIPESFVLLRSVKRVPFDAQMDHSEQVAAGLSQQTPVAILQNAGAVVVGESLLEAFGRLEVLEATIEAIIDGRRLGKICPIDPQDLRELCAALSLQ